MIPERHWDLAAGLILLAAAILVLAQWPAFPYFLDSAYHLAVIRGIGEASGPVLQSFWEAAPEGRAHLYPPLFHLAWVPAWRLHLPPMVMARLWSFAAFPLLLLAAWFVFRRIFRARVGCLTLIALATPYSFFLSTVNYLPATLVLIAGLGILLALHEKRWLAGGLLLALAFWTHLAFPWLILPALLLFGWVEPAYRKTAWRIAAAGLLGASPWILHLAAHLGELHLQPRGEERFLDASPLLLLLGAIGFRQAWRKGGIYRFLPALAVGFLPMLAGYRFRYFSSQGLFTWLLLSGVALDGFAAKARRPWAAALLLGGLLLGAPGIHWAGADHTLGERGFRWAWADTTLSVLAGRPAAIPRATARSVFKEPFIGELVETVAAQTAPDDLIVSNYDYVALLLSARTGRAATNLRKGDPIEPARLVIWLKDASGNPPEELRRIVPAYSLEPVQETQIALIYRNPAARGRKEIRPAVIPWWAGLSLLGLALGALVQDFRR